MHVPGQSITAHRHDWPTLVLCRLGSYRETSDAASESLDGPAVIFQPKGADHEDEIGDRGLETLSLTFDPAWLQVGKYDMPQTITWRPAGRAVLEGQNVARIWLDRRSSELEVAEATARLLAAMNMPVSPCASPPWMAQIERMIDNAVSTRSMADILSRHPAWLARAYRALRGEGIADTIRRRRVEQAVDQLRNTDLGIAAVAAECGFCDQAHMTRVFARMLGRTPRNVRDETILMYALRG